MVAEGVKRRWQVTAHTAGEGGMDVLLDAYEFVNRTLPIKRLAAPHARNFPSQHNLHAARPRRLRRCAARWLYKDGYTLFRALGKERIRWFPAVQEVAEVHDHRRRQRPHDQA